MTAIATIDKPAEVFTPLASINTLLQAEHEARRMRQEKADEARTALIDSAKQAIRVVLGDLAPMVEEGGKWYDDKYGSPCPIAALQVNLPEIEPFTVKAGLYDTRRTDLFSVSLNGYQKSLSFCAGTTSLNGDETDVPAQLAAFLYDQCAAFAARTESEAKQRVQRVSEQREESAKQVRLEKEAGLREEAKSAYRDAFTHFLTAFHNAASANRKVFETAAAEWLAPFPAWRLTYAKVAGGGGGYEAAQIETETVLSFAESPNEKGHYPVFLTSPARVVRVAYANLVSVEDIGLVSWGSEGTWRTYNETVPETAQRYYFAPTAEARAGMQAAIAVCRMGEFTPLPEPPVAPQILRDGDRGDIESKAASDLREAMAALQAAQEFIAPPRWAYDD